MQYRTTGHCFRFVYIKELFSADADIQRKPDVGKLERMLEFQQISHPVLGQMTKSRR